MRSRRAGQQSATNGASPFEEQHPGAKEQPAGAVEQLLPQGGAAEWPPLSGRYIWRLVWQQRWELAPALLALLACVVATLASPVLAGILFEALVKGRPFAEYRRLLSCLLALYVAEPLLARAYVKGVCRAGERVQAALRAEAFRVLLLQQAEFFDRHSSAALTALLSRDLDAVRAFVYANVCGNRGLRGLAEAIGAVLVLFWMSWRLAPVLAGVIVSSVVAVQLYRRAVAVAEGAHAAAQASAAQAASESLSNIRTVRTFAGEPLERRRYESHVAQALASGEALAGARALLEGVNRGAVHASLLALYGLGGYLVSSGRMPVRSLASAMSFTWALVYSCQGVLQTFADWRVVVAALRRVQAALAEMPADPYLCPGGRAAGVGCCSGAERVWSGQQENGAAAGAGGPGAEELAAAWQGDVELRDVSFVYPTRPSAPVLQGLSLVLRHGKATALVGRSGVGKTTVASLLLRLYPVSGGGIFLGGHPISAFTRAQWVAGITAVSQDPVLFSGTIAENIGYGRGMLCSQADIERAARAAHAHDFIAALPEGYATAVGERGSLLSGGQRQRIALARALLKDSPVLVLDEATSALDARSEQAVQAAIDRLVEGRTVLVIAHRLSTVQAADSIAVLEGGRVAEEGSHAVLTRRRSSLYTQLIASLSRPAGEQG